MSDGQLLTPSERIPCRNGIDLDAQLLSAVGECKSQRCLWLWGTLRPERQAAIVIAKPPDTVGEHHPSSTHGRNVTAVGDIATYVRQVHQQCRTSVLHSFLKFANLKGDNGLYAG